jgi:hypothetical protein
MCVCAPTHHLTASFQSRLITITVFFFVVRLRSRTSYTQKSKHSCFCSHSTLWSYSVYPRSYFIVSSLINYILNIRSFNNPLHYTTTSKRTNFKLIVGLFMFSSLNYFSFISTLSPVSILSSYSIVGAAKGFLFESLASCKHSV